VDSQKGRFVMRRISRNLRTLLAAAFAGAIAMAVLTSTSGAAPAPATPQLLVALHGGGAWSVYGPLVSWQNELATASSYVDLNYTPHGSALGREDLGKGLNDFAISGVPLTDGDVPGVKGGAAAYIDAPIQVATLATFVEPLFARPLAGFWTLSIICNPDDDTTWPSTVTSPDQCIERKEYTGPVRVPTRNLAAMYLHFRGTTTPSLNAWNNHDVMQAMGLDPKKSVFQTDSKEAAPGFAGRSDPDETTYFLQQFIKQGAPDIWQGEQDLDRRFRWEPITERFPRALNGVTRDGAEQQVDQLAQNGNGVIGTSQPQVSGGIAYAPPALMRAFKSGFPQYTLDFAEIKNAQGEWVAPTPDAINKAVDAGGDNPLYALTNPVSGAYPIVWVDHLYAPAHGLSVEKTEGIATLIRYLATTGQEKEAASGEGRLPAPLVAKALAAANELVMSNCTGSDRNLVSNSDPGPAAPATATAMKSIGTMLHCEPTVTATTTTTIGNSSTTSTTFPGSTVSSPTSSGGSYTGGSNSGAYSASSGYSAGEGSTSSRGTDSSGVSTGDQSTGSDGAAAAGNRRNASAQLVVATKLPMAAPGGAAGTDRLAAFLLGVLLYVLLRGPTARTARRLRT
jgi:ABC-type phosphate transport system substrate-binding protein